MKSVLFKMLILSTMLLFLSGCANCVRTPLSGDVKKNIKSNAAVVATTQKKMYFESYTNNGGAGANVACTTAGLAPATGFLEGILVDCVEGLESKYARTHAQVISKNLQGFNLAAVFCKSLNKQLKPIRWLNNKKVVVQKNMNMDEHEKYFAQVKENSMLFVDFYYSINFKITAVKINARVGLYRKDAKHQFISKPAYYNEFQYLYYLPVNVIDRAKAVTLWSKDHDELIKHALSVGAENIAKQVAKDMNNPKSELYKNMQSQKTKYFKGDYASLKLSGKLINKYGDFYVVRMPDDSVYIFNKNSLK